MSRPTQRTKPATKRTKNFLVNRPILESGSCGLIIVGCCVCLRVLVAGTFLICVRMFTFCLPLGAMLKVCILSSVCLSLIDTEKTVGVTKGKTIDEIVDIMEKEHGKGSLIRLGNAIKTYDQVL